ncbi:Retrovirus-related Pol polyprotein from transposon opus, partial [Mucuna pruriens]
MKLLIAGIIYPISDMKNQSNKLVPTRVIYRFILHWQINIRPPSLTCLPPLPTLGCRSTYAMPKHLLEAYKSCMDDFMVYKPLFDACWGSLSRVLDWCIETILMLNFEKCHFMATEGIALRHLVSNRGIEVDKAKIDIISSLYHPTKVRSFLRHASFYKRFNQNFNTITLPLSKLLFGVPKALISDQGSHFYNKTMSTLLEKYGMVHRVAAAYHPQINGQIEKRLEPIVKGCSLGSQDDLPNTIRNVPLTNKIKHRAYWAIKRCNLAFDQANKERKFQLQELKELCLEAYENSKIYKEKVKRFHDNMILRHELKDEPFIITNIFPYGTVEIRDEITSKILKVNGHQLKSFHESPTIMEGNVEDLSLVKPTLPD